MRLVHNMWKRLWALEMRGVLLCYPDPVLPRNRHPITNTTGGWASEMRVTASDPILAHDYPAPHRHTNPATTRGNCHP